MTHDNKDTTHKEWQGGAIVTEKLFQKVAEKIERERQRHPKKQKGFSKPIYHSDYHNHRDFDHENGIPQYLAEHWVTSCNKCKRWIAAGKESFHRNSRICSTVARHIQIANTHREVKNWDNIKVSRHVDYIPVEWVLVLSSAWAAEKTTVPHTGGDDITDAKKRYTTFKMVPYMKPEHVEALSLLRQAIIQETDLYNSKAEFARQRCGNKLCTCNTTHAFSRDLNSRSAHEQRLLFKYMKKALRQFSDNKTFLAWAKVQKTVNVLDDSAEEVTF